LCFSDPFPTITLIVFFCIRSSLSPDTASWTLVSRGILLKKVLPVSNPRKHPFKDGSVCSAPQGVLLLLSKVTQKHFRQQSHQKCFALSEGMPRFASAVDRFRFFEGAKGAISISIPALFLFSQPGRYRCSLK
jgi:hypothetical protein